MKRLAIPAAFIVLMLLALIASYWAVFSLCMIGSIFIDPRDLLDIEAILGVCVIMYCIYATQDALFSWTDGFGRALLRRRIFL